MTHTNPRIPAGSNPGYREPTLAESLLDQALALALAAPTTPQSPGEAAAAADELVALALRSLIVPVDAEAAAAVRTAAGLLRDARDWLHRARGLLEGQDEAPLTFEPLAGPSVVEDRRDY